ncbi:hypothetical protein [Salinarchaeum sp. Harcht-Bsk1]|uniref:hypothetical protein n=1 Tax=Salinarchaeum sp. Harcht-Bsk1 TaxID=1333523 RepID=UPI001181B424|nr:hypothetical protein [Salinarchaeum sp. Harcht-Bsk1]
MAGLWTAPLRLLAKMSSHVDTQAEVEDELNEQFAGKEWELETYSGQSVTLTIYSIKVRAPVDLGDRGSLEEPEMFDGLNWRDEPTLSERAKASLKNRWMTIVKFDVSEDPECLRPPGLNLGFASSISSSAVALEERNIVTRMVRITDEPAMHSNKLATKIIYDGSKAEYKESIDKVVDNVEYMQENMKQVAGNFLVNLYNPTKEEWGDEEMARDLSRYLLEEDVNIGVVELVVKDLWENPPAENEDSVQSDGGSAGTR